MVTKLKDITMNNIEWEVVDEVPGDLTAEILKGLLEAQGIPVLLSQEGLGHSAIAITVGSLGRVQMLVPPQMVERARQVLKDYQNGVFEKEETPSIPEDDDNTTDQITGSSS
jgi:hypothetical protein